MESIAVANLDCQIPHTHTPIYLGAFVLAFPPPETPPSWLPFNCWDPILSAQMTLASLP